MNNNTLLIIIALAAVAGVIFFVLRREKNKPVTDVRNPRYVPELDPNSPRYDPNYRKPTDEIEGLPIRGVKKKFKFDYVTPLGVKVGSTVEIPEAILPLIFKTIEYGVQNGINAMKHKFPHWTRGLTMPEVTVAFIEPHGENRDGSPHLWYNNNPEYATAGTALGVGNDIYPVPMIVVPHQAEQNWLHVLYLMYSVWNEYEHFVEFLNDRNEALKYTGAYGTDDHQHHNLPEGVTMLTPETVRGFISKPAIRSLCYCQAKNL